MSRYRRNSRSIEEIASDPTMTTPVLIEIVKRSSEATRTGSLRESLAAYDCADLCIKNPGLNVVDFCKAYSSGSRDYYSVTFCRILENFATDLAMLDGSIGEVASKFCYECAISILAVDGHRDFRITDRLKADPSIFMDDMKSLMFLRTCNAIKDAEDAGHPVPGKVPESSYRKLAQIAAMYLPEATRYGVRNNVFPSVMMGYMPNARNGYRRGKARRLPRQEGLLPLRGHGRTRPPGGDGPAPRQEAHQRGDRRPHQRHPDRQPHRQPQAGARPMVARGGVGAHDEGREAAELEAPAVQEGRAQEEVRRQGLARTLRWTSCPPPGSIRDMDEPQEKKMFADQVLPDDTGKCEVIRRKLSSGRHVTVVFGIELTPVEAIEVAEFLSEVHEGLGQGILEEVWDLVPIPLHTGRDAALALPINPTSEEINELRGDLLVLSGAGVIEDALRDDPSVDGQPTLDPKLN